MRTTRQIRTAIALALGAAMLATTTAVPTALADAGRGCTNEPDPGADPRSVDYRFGGLAEAVLRVSVPVEQVRSLVPARYRLLDEQTGTASLVAAFGSVDELTVECSHARPAVVSEYGVFIDSPDGSAGRHAYYLWQLSDDQMLVNRLRALGLPAYFAASGFGAATAADGTVSVAAQTLWSESPNRLSATATEPGTVPGPSLPGVRFWYDGRHGTVRVAYECPACLPRTPATGTVSATPGTRLDEVLGGGERSGAGFFIRTHLLARAELVGL